MKKIAIIGAGSTGHTVAAELSLRGHEVRLCDNETYRDVLEETARRGVISITGSMGEGTASIHLVTTDPARALEGADLVICCTLTTRDQEVAQWIAPHLRPDSVVLLSAGGLGTLIYRRVFDRAGLTGVVVGETCGNLFPCRLVEPGLCRIGLPYMTKKVAALPYCDTPRLIEAFAGVYAFAPADSILDTALNGPNLIGHIVLTLLNAGAIENATETYYVFEQGICRSAMNLADAMFLEKKQVMDALGLPAGASSSGTYRKYQDPQVHEYDHFKRLAGPDAVTNRYISEDTPTLVCLFLSVARALDIDVPLFRSMERIASAVNQTDYYAAGRTLENLGLGDLHGKDALLDFFRNRR